jgi:hypothetical protein
MKALHPLAPEDARARIDELVREWRVPKGPTIQALRRDSDLVPLTVFGLAAQANALAKAVRDLEAAGEGAQIVPLVRQVLECSVTAMWVEKYGRRAALTLQRGDARSRVQMFREFVRSGVPDDGSVEHWTEELKKIDPAESRHGEKFFERCQELDGMTGTYAMYRALSALSHASGTVISLYTVLDDVTPDNPVGVALARQPREWAQDAVVGICLTYLLFAQMAWDRLDGTHRARSRLKQIAGEMGLQLSWTQSAVGLKRHSEWERSNRVRSRAVGSR